MPETADKSPRRARRITRRALLSGAAVIMSITPSRFGAAAPMDLAQFLRLSEKLTARRNLPPEPAKRYLRSIVDGAGHHHVTADGRALRHARIVADWYSGQTIESAGLASVDYTGALLWDAIGFAKPRGVPDAEAGSWTLSPA